MPKSPLSSLVLVLLAAAAPIVAGCSGADAAVPTDGDAVQTTETALTPYEAAEGADALCVVTPWNEFKQADLARVSESMRTPLILDGRNMYDPNDIRALGITYVGVGR